MKKSLKAFGLTGLVGKDYLLMLLAFFELFLEPPSNSISCCFRTLNSHFWNIIFRAVVTPGVKKLVATEPLFFLQIEFLVLPLGAQVKEVNFYGLDVIPRFLSFGFFRFSFDSNNPLRSELKTSFFFCFSISMVSYHLPKLILSRFILRLRSRPGLERPKTLL